MIFIIDIKMRMIVLDSSAILHSTLSFSSEERYLIPNSVLREIKNEQDRLVVRSAIKNKKLRVSDPGKDSVERVLEKAKITGDADNLSETDIEVLALALEKEGEIITDDYGIQNVASALGIKYIPAAKRGIKKQFRWVYVCKGCSKKYPERKEQCDVCGSMLKKVVKDKNI